MAKKRPCADFQDNSIFPKSVRIYHVGRVFLFLFFSYNCIWIQVLSTIFVFFLQTSFLLSFTEIQKLHKVGRFSGLNNNKKTLLQTLFFKIFYQSQSIELKCSHWAMKENHFLLKKHIRKMQISEKNRERDCECVWDLAPGAALAHLTPPLSPDEQRGRGAGNPRTGAEANVSASMCQSESFRFQKRCDRNV